MVPRIAAAAAICLLLAACNGSSQIENGSYAPALRTSAFSHRIRHAGPSGYISHVVIIVQENRSFDDLFNGFPGANTVQSGENSFGQTVQLQPESLTAPYDLSHTHPAFVTEYANGNLNGFNLEHESCGHTRSVEPMVKCPPKQIAAYGYVPESNVQPYWDMAEQYTIADNMFETNQGPSFPAHQYLISGTSTISYESTLRASENPVGPKGHTAEGGCDSKTGSLVTVIDEQGNEDQSVFPCFDRVSLMGEANAAYVSWRYYVGHLGPGFWNAPDAIDAIRYGNSYYADVVAPPSQVLTDIYNGNLASIVWVTPTSAESDHPFSNNGTGPSWVASIVNAIGDSYYWNNTAILVTWDDWGGWFDHVSPPIFNSYEDSFRVPLLVISPYAKQGYVSHVQHEFGSLLKFTEETFGLPSMGTTDKRSDDLADCFDFQQPKHRFKPIRARYSGQYFLHEPPSNKDPDDDW
jgi:phospholipase C